MKSSGCFDPDIENVQDGPENMAFVGVKRGDYIQELTYKYVGDGNGEFDMLSSPPKPRSNVCWFTCMCSAISIIVGCIFWGLVVDRPLFAAATTTTIMPLPVVVKAALSCDVQELHTGDEIEARYAISFLPAGHLPPGSLGQVVATIPSSGGDGHSMVVNWFGNVQLQGSKVSRSQIEKVLKAGDKVEALVRIEPPTPSGTPSGSPTDLQVDDLLLATRNVNDRIPRGTYGYVVQVLSAGQYRYTVDFPEFPQFADTEVLAEDVVKAPLVADRVKASEVIDYGNGAVAAGTLGTVVTMDRESITYKYVVQWDDVPEMPSQSVSGLKLKVHLASERPAIPAIPQGSQGKVVGLVRNLEGGVEKVMVSWDGYPEAGAANVSRVKLTKAPDWKEAHRKRCCDEEGIGCVPLQKDGSSDLYNCKILGDWSENKRKWCCQWKGVRCPSATYASQANASKQAGGATVPAVRPIFNCSTHEQWPEAKQQYCCLHQSIGCNTEGAHASAGGTTPSGWTSLVSDACKGAAAESSISLALDEARAELMNQQQGHCLVALVEAEASGGKQCAGSVTPKYVVEGSKSVTIYSTQVGQMGTTAASAGADPGSCWMMTHKGCSVNSTEKGGCTHFLFEEGSAKPTLFG